MADEINGTNAFPEVDDELLAKARAASSPEELAALAAEAGIELTEEQVGDAYARLHAAGELSDDELDDVAGGCGSDEEEAKYCPMCNARLRRAPRPGGALGAYFCPNGCF